MDEKGEGSPELVAGRIEELRRLEASERAVADAFFRYAQTVEGRDLLLPLVERHRRNARLLAERIRALGGRTDVEPDDAWLIGDPEKRETIVFALQTAQRTYHDHLLDLDPESIVLVRDRILPGIEESLAQLTGEGGLMQQSLEYG